jgi:hypothetical protein
MTLQVTVGDIEGKEHSDITQVIVYTGVRVAVLYMYDTNVRTVRDDVAWCTCT